jgi:hypothetical protein
MFGTWQVADFIHQGASLNILQAGWLFVLITDSVVLFSCLQLNRTKTEHASSDFSPEPSK